jgi:hypothetical protein
MREHTKNRAKQPAALSFRVDGSLHDLIDREMAIEREQHPGLRVAKSDVVKMLLSEAIVARHRARKSS